MSMTEQIIDKLSQRYDEWALHICEFRSYDRALHFLESMSFTTREGLCLNYPPNIWATVHCDPANDKAYVVIGGMLTVAQNYEILEMAKSVEPKIVVNSMASGDEASQNLTAAGNKLKTDHPEFYQKKKKKKWWQFWD